MNVAFPAIVVFLLIAPGLIYLTVRPPQRANRLPPRPPTPLSSEAVVVLISSIALHLAWFVAVSAAIALSCSKLHLWPRAVLIFLSGHAGGSDAEYSAAVDSVAGFPVHVAFYFLGLYFVSGIAAWQSGSRIDPLLIRLGLLPDREALSREWQKFFVTDDQTITIVTTVVDLGGVAYLFVGKLVELYFDPDTQKLDRFALEDVWRRRLADDVPPAVGARILSRPDHAAGNVQAKEPTAEELISDQWHSIEGQLFIIRYAEAKTINIRYWHAPP